MCLYVHDVMEMRRDGTAKPFALLPGERLVVELCSRWVAGIDGSSFVVK